MGIEFRGDYLQCIYKSNAPGTKNPALNLMPRFQDDLRSILLGVPCVFVPEALSKTFAIVFPIRINMGHGKRFGPVPVLRRRHAGNAPQRLIEDLNRVELRRTGRQELELHEPIGFKTLLDFSGLVNRRVVADDEKQAAGDSSRSPCKKSRKSALVTAES